MNISQFIEFYNKWEITQNNLKRAKDAEIKLFEELKGILRLHPELGNRDCITTELKIKIAELAIKKYNTGSNS